jgi:acyl-coenzyme A thioesterase PaaI-like protein
MVIGAELVFDHPDNLCFGCSPHNERGMQVRFTHVEPSAVEARYTAAAHTCGAPGVIHGGVQAVLLDEAVGFAIHAHEGDFDTGADPGIAPVVTVEFHLRYRRPAPTGVELILRGEILSADGPDYYAEASIQDAAGEVLTQATARWKRLSPR